MPPCRPLVAGRFRQSTYPSQHSTSRAPSSCHEHIIKGQETSTENQPRVKSAEMEPNTTNARELANRSNDQELQGLTMVLASECCKLQASALGALKRGGTEEEERVREARQIREWSIEFTYAA